MLDATTLLFGLPGLQVANVTRRDDGTRIVDAVSDDDIAGACQSCGVFSPSAKQQTTTTPKDIPYGESRIILRWNKTGSSGIRVHELDSRGSNEPQVVEVWRGPWNVRMKVLDA